MVNYKMVAIIISVLWKLKKKMPSESKQRLFILHLL